jgi:hypothetical protein
MHVLTTYSSVLGIKHELQAGLSTYWHAYCHCRCCCWSQIVVTCLLTQMNYLNKALDLFNTAIVSPIYYVMFTLLTIVASVIMFQVRTQQR